MMITALSLLYHYYHDIIIVIIIAIIMMMWSSYSKKITRIQAGSGIWFKKTGAI